MKTGKIVYVECGTATEESAEITGEKMVDSGRC